MRLLEQKNIYNTCSYFQGSTVTLFLFILYITTERNAQLISRNAQLNLIKNRLFFSYPRTLWNFSADPLKVTKLWLKNPGLNWFIDIPVEDISLFHHSNIHWCVQERLNSFSRRKQVEERGQLTAIMIYNIDRTVCQQPSQY